MSGQRRRTGGGPGRRTASAVGARAALRESLRPESELTDAPRGNLEANGEGFAIRTKGRSWGRLARTICPRCGSGEIRWLWSLLLLWEVDDLDERKVLCHLLDLWGGHRESWICRECHLWGVFLPVDMPI